MMRRWLAIVCTAVSALTLQCLAGMLLVSWLRGCMTEHDRPRGHLDITFSVAPDEQAIAFNAAGKGGMDLYLLDLRSRSVRRIAETPDYEVAPCFSPDGKSIAYAAGRPGDRADHLYVRSLEGRQVRQLTSGEANDCSPSYFPDGSRIIFARDTHYKWGGLAANWSDGGSVWSIGAGGERPQRLLPEQVFAVSPRVSPDGKMLVWWDTDGIRTARLNADGALPAISVRGAREVAISPRGDKIAYTAGTYSPDMKIYMRSMRSGPPIEVARAPYGCFLPEFGPDGRMVYYLVEEWPSGPSGEAKRSLWRVDDRGGHRQIVADSRLFDDPLHWRP
jgi:Tol biopolymer transport system component